METTFQDLGLSEGLLTSLTEAGYTHPTPIQAKAIPAVLMMRDVMGCAQTGTGKTASFTLPMIDVLAEGQGRAKMPRSLILSPTRELAAQIAENFQKYTRNHSLKMALLIGGESMRDQEDALNKGVDVLIATPGRMLDLFDRGAIILNDVKIFVIDEADRMLDMGFIPDIETIVSKLPKNRQTLMFSATMPDEIRKLADKFLDNPKEITVAPPSSTASTVEHRVLHCGPREKRNNLRTLLEQDPPESAIIFCNRKRDIGVLVRSLKRHGYSAGELHGDLSQPVRMDTLEKFKAGDISLLVCSDVAARGIDVASVSHVFNFDVPNHPEDYVHRIGRTGRAGRDGKAVMFATNNDDKALAAIEDIIGKKIDVVDGFAKTEPMADASETTEEKPANGRGGRNRGPRRASNKDNDAGAEATTHQPIPVNMAAWSDFIEEDVRRAADVFEGMIPAFLLRLKNAPELTPLEELDQEVQAEAEEEPKSKPKRKRSPRKRKPKQTDAPAADSAKNGDEATPEQADNSSAITIEIVDPNSDTPENTAAASTETVASDTTLEPTADAASDADTPASQQSAVDADAGPTEALVNEQEQVAAPSIETVADDDNS